MQMLPEKECVVAEPKGSFWAGPKYKKGICGRKISKQLRAGTPWTGGTTARLSGGVDGGRALHPPVHWTTSRRLGHCCLVTWTRLAAARA